MESGTMGLCRIDHPSLPKEKTGYHLVQKSTIGSIKEGIENSNLGALNKGFLGRFPIELNFMSYTPSPAVLENYRAAVDNSGTQLSTAYFFKQPAFFTDSQGEPTMGVTPLNVFLFVMKPWLPWQRKDLYSVVAYARSPDKQLLRPTVAELEKIIRNHSKKQ